MSWDDDKVAQLRKLWADGLSASQIAAQLDGVTRNAVIGKVIRLGLAARAPRGPDRKAARRAQQRQPRKSFVSDVWAKFGGSGPEGMPVGDDPADHPDLVALVDLEPHQCKWPIGDPKHGRFGFCGHERETGLPYCAAHARRAYKAPESRREANRRVGAPVGKRVKEEVQ